MKLRRLAVMISVILLTLILASIFNVTNAATGSKYLGIEMLRKSGFGYRAGQNKNIWKIVEATDSSGSVISYDSAIYCIKGGPGFGSENYTEEIKHYTQYFDMKDPDSIPSPYIEALPAPNSTEYKALLWLLEHIYVPASENATSEEITQAREYKQQLLEASYDYDQEQYGLLSDWGYLTDDDIEVVQQIAIWHFTNEGDSYDLGGASKTFELYINTVKGQADPLAPLSSEIGAGAVDGWYRADEAIALYRYLIDTAEAEAGNYEVAPASQPYELADLNATVRTEGNSYIIGPFRIDQVSDTEATLEGKFTLADGTEIKPTLQSASGSTFNSLNDTIGQEFYIVVPTSTDISQITFTISGVYYNTKIEYWAMEDPTNEQPVAIVEREETPYEDSVTITYEEPEPEIFDLALRKFIVSINGESPTVSRVPQISEDTISDLRDGSTTTAEKIHTKDPLIVETGDSVIYTIRVYNEGNVDGIVTEITDYLPDGLSLKANSSTNTQYGWVDNGDGTITTNYLNGRVLDAFDGTTLDYLDVQIECEVTARASENGTSLKNVAEITGATNSEGEDMTDRDSTPDNVDVPGYGNSSQEDDDDFENLIMEGKYFDLALRKFIVSINGTAPTESRVPVVDVTPLTSGTGTTAEKIHPKDPLTVETGDSVVYTIRVYNEGDIDGIVTEITDYLPDGLSLKADSSINTQYGWVDNGDGTITTNYLSGQILDAFNGTTLDYLDVQIECEVVATVTDTDINLKNIAEITGATDSEGNDVPEDLIDRDSTPDNVNVPGYGNSSQEDDDDFEDLVILGKYFDLALRKFIISINGIAPTESREPVVDTTPLTSGSGTTAEKVHPKNPLIVETGDSVVYTIRVYNEGQIDGIVTEITDYLPDGLSLKADSSINTQYGWVDNGDGTITTNYLSGQILDAFNGTTLDYLDVQIECEVVATVTDTDINLKNIAEITGATDSEGNDVPEDLIDRDSTPDNVDVPGYGDESQEDDDDFEDLVIPGKYFDLSLRKFIIQVNDTELKDEDGNYLREPVVDTTPLTSGSGTTAIYNHPKDPVEVAVGDEVIYTLRVYNEGQLDGYVYEITDYLPANLEFIINDELNAKYGWQISSDGRTVTTDITSPDTEYSASRDTIYADRKTGADKVILDAFDGTNLDYIDVQIKCRVKDTALPEEKLTNIAEITDFTDSNKEEVTDRDSAEDNVTIPSDSTLPNYKDTEINRGDEYIPGQEDDDDFEKLIIKKFDLALRKFITGVNENEVTDRYPVFNNNNGVYTYTHTKDPILVKTGDIIIYTIRVYNEGDIAGYAEEVKDDLPEGLEFIPDNTMNVNYRWVMYDANGEVTESVEEAETIRTDYLSKAQEDSTGRDNLIDAFDPDTMPQPDYREVRIAFRVTEPNTSDRILINTAEISEDSNEDGEPVDDVDSTPDNDEPEEDDIDIEKVKVIYFDLALRKFITGVNDDTITNRVPVFTYEDGKCIYTHTKEPIEVSNGDIIIYTLRVYNEGTQAGYAEEVKDDLPEGLEFLPDNEVNTEYRWVMYDANGEVTENVEEAVTIRTDYLSKAQEDETGRDNLIEAFDPETMSQPDYKDLEIAFRVTEPNTSDRVLINTAEISEDSDEDGEPVDDVDSTPNNDQDGEDDIDIEKVKVTYFDLALEKIITKVTMTLDGETYVDETGHKFGEKPEEVVKVELGNHKIEDSVLKFTYKIRITNEGNKAGYAYEVKDYIPKGLEFVAEDNDGSWTLSEDGKTVTTDKLKDTLLEPGESADVEITLRWINGQTNLGVKTNWAEISKDSDDDIDSTPDNNKKGEDDIDDAEVVLSIVTGVGEHYIGVITAVLVLLAGGIILIKKFVL